MINSSYQDFPFVDNESLTRKMSPRQYAAIKLRVPDSGTDWLDAMIEKSLLNEFAGKAMQGFIAYMGCDPDANDQLGGVNKDMLSSSSYKYATAMLKASKETK